MLCFSFFKSNAQKDTIKQEMIYQICTDLPKYVEGNAALGRLIDKILNYPEAAKKNNIQGTVVIRMVVEKDGSLTNFEILVSQNPIFNEEALRIAKLISKFIPGKQMDKVIRCYYTFPINFKLDEQGNIKKHDMYKDF